jgi:outer membrane protein assembly factor BamB/class 3 adenylate cyclase
MTTSLATRGFLFADLRGYTHFVETHGDEAAARLLKAYRALMRDVIARYGAAEIKTEGDSFYIVFPTASSAIEGGRAILDAAAEATARDPSLPIQVGIGVHAGETEDTGEGPVGLAVNIAARVCAQARPGELLVTDTVRSLTRTRMSVRFVPRGSPRLKGIAEPIPLYAVAAEVAVVPVRRPWLNRFTIGAGAAALAAVAIGAFVVLGRTPKVPATAAGLPCAAASATPAPIADVSVYRADFNRTSVYPGPGPQCQPVLAWQRRLGAVSNFVPIVVLGQVIVGDQNGLHAFDARTGKQGWTFPGAGGFAESALADKDVVYAADLGGTLHAIDAKTGTERWKTSLPNNGIHPTIGSGLIWVGSIDGHAYGLDPSTGEQRWKWDGPSGKPAAVELVTDEAAYVLSGGTVYAIRLVDRAELWHNATGGSALAGPVMSGDSIYVAARPQGASKGALFALDRKTGANRWRPFAIASGKQITPGPVQGGVLYVTTDGDGVYALRDKGSEYSVVWHNPNVSFSPRPASLAGKVLYVQQHEGTMVALRADTGEILWKTPAAAAGEEPPVVTGGLVFQVDAEGTTLRAWAEPNLAAKLGIPTSPEPGPSAPPAPNPFTVVATFPWFETGIQIPASMDIGPDGLLYVLHGEGEPDYRNPKVTIIDPNTGRPVKSWGRYGSAPGELDLTAGGGNGPGGCIAVSSEGLVYVGERGNQRVDVFTRDGKPFRQVGVGKLGPILFCRLGADGSLYTVEDEPSNLISKFSPSGKLVWQHLLDPAHPTTAFQIHGIVVRPDGKILGFVDATGQAVVLDPTNGHVLARWGQPGNAPGDLGLSGEPSVDAKGNIYVFQYVPQALQIFDPSGHFLGGIYEDSTAESGYQFDGSVFWPAPVFAPDGFGYSFGPDGLVRMKITLPRS